MDPAPLSYFKRLSEVFLNKPDLVIDFPGWMLPESLVQTCRETPGLAIVEIAGRDSVAAAVKSVEAEGFTGILPVYAYTGTEYGTWASVIQAVKRFERRLPEVCVHPLLVAGSPEFWRALNGRFIAELVRRYGFYSPCPGCHLYLHAVRIPLSKRLGNLPVISGERELHSGMVKVNQTAEALDFYLDFARRFGVSLKFPLRDISSGDEIEDILGMPWGRGKDQLGCTLSGNYRLLNGGEAPSPDDVTRFFTGFAGPVAAAITEAYINGRVPNHTGVAERVLAGTLA